MRSGTIIVWLGALPVAGLLFLSVAGLVPVWAAIGMVVLAVLAIASFALTLARDIRIVSDRIGRVGTAQPVDRDLPAPILLDRLAGAIDRLSRQLTGSAARMEQYRRADSLILEHLPDPLILLTADRAVRRANAAAHAAFGEDIPAVLRHPDLRAAIDRSMAAGTTETAEISLPVPTPRHVRATVVPIDPPLADGGRAVVVLSDRTREKRVEQMRADFVANVSHELRTPLASLIGFTDTLRGPAADDPAAQQRFLGIMAEQGARMNRLIDDLLSLSRIELSEHQPPLESIELRSLLSRVAAGFEPTLAEREVRLEADLAGDLPVIPGDADQLAQVLQNLFDNAVKYGRKGSTIRVTAHSAEPGSGRWPRRPGVILTVSDQGIGIPREHLPRLTERFYRVDKGRSRAIGGTGLGLAIVKHIVNRHRGQLLIESQEGEGTTVSIWLPATQPGQRPVAA